MPLSRVLADRSSQELQTSSGGAWCAGLALDSASQTLRPPSAGVEPHRAAGHPLPGEVRRIGLLAIGTNGEAELCRGRLAVY